MTTSLSRTDWLTAVLCLFLCVGTAVAQNALRTTTLQPCLAPFYHGVASGDPMEDKVIIWTRVTPDTVSSDPVLVSWRMATDTGMTNIVQSGSLMTDNTRDYTVKVDVQGLSPYTWYYYEFSTNGLNSPRGRTRTTPSMSSIVDSIRFAVVSCANYEAGFFNSYKALLDRADFDAVIHLGDYIYEYETGGYAPNATANRTWLPANEILSLSDYRERYSTYHLDDDLRMLHQQFPFITIWDDHETANDSWMNGAENHQANEGPFAVRKSNANQAYFEWLPIRETSTTDPYQIFRRLNYGNLVDLIMLDTRLHGREEQMGTSGSAVTNPNRQLLGADQCAWMDNRLDSSLCRWKILTQQVMVAPLRVFGSAVNGDQWDGYPAERDRLFNHILTNNVKDVVVITGDIHSSWANDLPTSSYNGSTGGGSAGVEFVGPSVTSPGMNIPAGASLIMASNSHIKYADLSQHGFMILDINQNRVQNDWYYVPTVDYSSASYSWGQSFYVNHLERFLRNTPTVSFPRQDIFGPMAPLCPRVVSPVSIKENAGGLVISNVCPNPANTNLVISFINTSELEGGDLQIVNAAGQIVKKLQFEKNELYNAQLYVDLSDLADGFYTGSVQHREASAYFKFIKQKGN
jgi:alkaline phosphatase D